MTGKESTLLLPCNAPCLNACALCFNGFAELLPACGQQPPGLMEPSVWDNQPVQPRCGSCVGCRVLGSSCVWLGQWARWLDCRPAVNSSERPVCKDQLGLGLWTSCSLISSCFSARGPSSSCRVPCCSILLQALICCPVTQLQGRFEKRLHAAF